MVSLPNFRPDPIRAVEEIHSTLREHDPIEELNRGFAPHEAVENVFADVIQQTFGRGGVDRNFWRRQPEIRDDFSIDFSIDFANDRYDRGGRGHFGDRENFGDRGNLRDRSHYADRDYGQQENVDLFRTSRELMSTLDKHGPFINSGKHNDRISEKELKNYIERVGHLIPQQELADLMLIKNNFKQISRMDGHKEISYSDMAYFVMANRDNDRMIRADRQQRNSDYASNNNDMGWTKPTEVQNQRREVQQPSRIVTSPNAPAEHFRVEGADIALSQEEFKAHYGIPKEIDLTKFMRTKANDGQVPNFWNSKVAAGLGGRDGDDLRWNNADHHDPALDFQRNFAQLSEYFDKLPPDQQVEFAFNFARTQGDVLRMHGVKLLAVDNEKIQITEDGSTHYVDFVQDVGSVKHLLQWGVEA